MSIRDIKTIVTSVYQDPRTLSYEKLYRFFFRISQSRNNYVLFVDLHHMIYEIEFHYLTRHFMEMYLPQCRYPSASALDNLRISYYLRHGLTRDILLYPIRCRIMNENTFFDKRVVFESFLVQTCRFHESKKILDTTFPHDVTSHIFHYLMILPSDIENPPEER